MRYSPKNNAGHISPHTLLKTRDINDCVSHKTESIIHSTQDGKS